MKIARDAGGEPIVESVMYEYEELRDKLLATARHGAVLISPCISDGERQIARKALKAGLPLVTMQNKGFSKLQKPSGRLLSMPAPQGNFSCPPPPHGRPLSAKSG